MNTLQSGVLLVALGWAAWTDWRYGFIDDRVSCMIVLSYSSGLHLLYGLCMTLGLFCMAQYSRRMGMGDVLLLGSLSGVLSHSEFCALCMFVTGMIALTGGMKHSAPLGPWLWIGTVVLCVIQV